MTARFTGYLRRDEQGRLEYSLAEILHTPNVWHGHHWRVKDRETKRWEHAIAGAFRCTSVGLLPATADPSRIRMRVTVTRFVPSRRQFIRDRDNLAFAVKPLNDALTRLGLIRDDSQAWLEQPLPEQAVSTDGQGWTRIVLGPCEGGPTA